MMTRILAGNREDAEDLVQESFLRAHEFYHTYDPEKASFATWFNSILFNCLRKFKSEKVQIVSLSTCDISQEDAHSGVISTPERRDHLAHLIEMVTNDEHRVVLRMFFVFGFSTKEIAQLNDCTQTNVTTIISRFRKGL